MLEASECTVLVVEHEPGAPAAWLGEWLTDAGVGLDVRRPHAGEPLPTDLGGYAGMVVLGGSMDSWDDAGFAWLPQVRSLIRAAEERGVPVLGICLGHQLACAALGGTVARNPAGLTVRVLEVGWLPDAAADPLLGSAPGRWAVHWNSDVVERLPEGATVLARTPDGAVQAARLGRSTWGVQFHPEAGPDVVARWVREDGAAYDGRGLDLDRYVADVQARAADLAQDWRRLAVAFAALLAGEGSAR